MHYCSLGEGIYCSCFHEKGLVLYWSREKGDWAVRIGCIGFIYIKPKSLSVYLDKIFHTDNG